ncbi:hypothetical protein 162322510 [Organic Lake phycodnavirus 1]|jgi:hypothetical protein|nr:hypothetical protein 162322510 [Organic Lake phycodnavirus 1]
MAFAFNAALIKNDEPTPVLEKPKINKDNLKQLLKPTVEKSKEIPSEIDIVNIHSNIQEENDDELAQFYHKESTPQLIQPSNEFILEEGHPSIGNPLLNKINHILELLEQQKEVKTNQKNEEIVLYCFLGLFILYIIDSFVSIGKYSR